MKQSIRNILIISATLLVSSPAFSAAYMKLGDVKGEAHQATAEQRVKAPEQKPQGLLLPAVQSAREAARRPAAQTEPSRIQPNQKPQAATMTPEQAEALRKKLKEILSKPCGMNTNKPCH